MIGRTMTDHIVVFDGHDRLVGRTLSAKVKEASPFTLFGDVETGEIAGEDLVAREAVPVRRVGLPLV